MTLARVMAFGRGLARVPIHTLQLDGAAIATAFKAVMLEGVEIIFIVIAAGAGAMIVPAG